MTENILLVAAVSVDALLASFAYGADNIKIPFLSAAVISAAGTAVLMLSMLLSGAADAVIPSGAGRWLGFIILMCIGTVSLFQNALKTFLRNKSGKNLSFSISGVGFVVSVFLDETKADTDKSKTLSPREALTLAIALSADSLGSGFGAGLAGAEILPVCIMSFGAGLAAVAAGAKAGAVTGKKRPGISWISGILLIILAFMNLIK